MKKFSFFFYILTILFFSNTVAAQSLSIQNIQQVYKPGEKIVAKVIYENDQQLTAIPTLLMTAVDTLGGTWQKRWAVLSDTFEVVMDIPENTPHGYYAIQFKLLQNMFTIKGTVTSPGRIRKLNSTLLTANGDFFEKDVTVLPDSSFVYTNVLFANDAVLSFKTPSNDDNLNIRIEQAVDSVLSDTPPLNFRLFVGSLPEKEKLPDPFKNLSENSFPVRDMYTLDVVTVESTKKSLAEKYNDKYSNGLFKAGNERLLDPSKDGIGYQNIFQYLQGRVAGLRIDNFGFNARAIWRNSPVYFYVDEMRVDANFVSSIPVSDIALVKAYPPPFFGNPGGGGGAIGIYTKRGDQLTDTDQTTFKVSGYSPFETSFLPDRRAN